MTGNGERPDGQTLGEFARTLRSGSTLVAVASMILLALALTALRAQPDTYVGRALVLVPAIPASIVTDPVNRQRMTTLDTEANRALSDSVVAEVASATGFADPRDAMRISALPVSRVLVMEFRGDDREVVDAGVEAWTQSYIRAQSEYVGQLSQDVVDALGKVPMVQVAAQIGALTGSDPESVWRLTVNAHTQREKDMRQLASNPATVVRHEAAQAEGKQWPIWAATALMVGVLAGSGVARWRSRPDPLAHPTAPSS